ncbi:hypothetical protein BURK2_00942 [Burkholderiales bacterium]|nr:hypothetical protein BURK2_00942 [Burkholderiales bacterium]
MEWWWLAVVVLVLVGFAGLVLPVLPGVLFIFAGLWLGAWIDAYERVGVAMVVLIGVLGLIGWVIDFVAGLLGAKAVGASAMALGGAALGALLGLFFGLPGLILGPVLGAVAGEFLARRDPRRAAVVGVAAGIGFVVALALKIGLAVAMVSVFALAWWI